MPQAVPFVAAAATAFFTGGTIAGVSAAVTAGTLSLGATLIYGAVEVGIYAGLSLAFNAAFGPKPPGAGPVQNTIKSGFAPRRSGFGRARTGGTYVLYEAAGKTAYQVLAMHDGRIDGWERYFLHDDEVDVDVTTGGVWCPGDTQKYAYGGPPGDRVFIETATGGQIAPFALPHAGLPTIWTSDHIGTDVAGLSLTCKQSKRKYQQKDFPNGLPIPTAVGRWQRVYDPRPGDQIAPTDIVKGYAPFLYIARNLTWTWTDNPVLQLMAYLVVAYGGMDMSYDAVIEPALDDWIAAANVCDELVDLAGGGTEKRYTSGGLYNHDGDPDEVVSQLLASFDGWLGQRGDGAFTIKAGQYEAPTVTLTDDHVTAYSVQHFTADEQALNEVVPSYTNPAQYTTDDAGALRNEADITSRGRVRSKALDYNWVQSRGQARRLAKRVLNRGAQELRGSLTTNFYGFAALGERYLQLQISENSALADIPIEVTRVEMDLGSLTLNIDWLAADPNIDDWSPSEEAADNTGGNRPVDPALTPSTITSVTPIYQQSGGAADGARLQVVATSPAAEDVDWLLRWRVAGSPAGPWHEEAFTDVDDGASVTLMTGFVSANDSLEVEVAYTTISQTSDWSAPYTVVTDAPIDALVDALVPGTGTSITDNGDGTITIGQAANSQPFGFAFQKSISGITVSTAFAFFDTPLAWTMPASLTDSQGTIGGTGATAPSAQTDFDIQVSGVSVGTMRFAASSLTATFIKASSTAVSLGAVTSIVAPSNLNGMAGTLFGSIKGTR